jgi:hypothetical protein
MLGSCIYNLTRCYPTQSQNCVVRLGCGRRTLAKLTFQRASHETTYLGSESKKCITHQSLKVQSRSRERSSSLHKDSFPTQTSRPSAIFVRIRFTRANHFRSRSETQIFQRSWNNQFDPAMYAVILTWAVNAMKDGHISPPGSWSIDAFVPPAPLTPLGCDWRPPLYYLELSECAHCAVYKRTSHYICNVPAFTLPHAPHPLQEIWGPLRRLHTHNTRSDGECKTHSSSLRRTDQDFLSRVMRPQALSPQERIREVHQSSDGPFAPEKEILTRHHGTWLAPVPLW